MKPLLAQTYESHRVTYPCYVQPKLNGVRALYQNGCFQSRDELPFPRELLSHLTFALSQLPPHMILDGELYVHGWPLQRILGAVTPVRQQANELTPLVEYHVFDNVKPYSTFEERHVWSKIFTQPPIFRVPSYLVRNSVEADTYYAHFVAQGYEGMMYRLGYCPYTTPRQVTVNMNYTANGGHHMEDGIRPPGRLRFWSDKDNRCWHLLKRKDWQDDEFEFVSINETTGELGEPGFQLWCRAKNGSLFKFGTGLTDAEVERYLSAPPVGRKVKGKYLTLSEDGIPQNGTILAII